MKPAWPEIHLDAVNKAAAELFSRRDTVNSDETKRLVGDLTSYLDDLNCIISSIDGQLETRTDPIWEESALRARRRYKRQATGVIASLKTARLLLETINSQNARREKSLRVETERVLTAKERLAREQARLSRIKAANTETQVWCAEFKKVCKSALGEARYMELVNETNKRLERK